MAQAVPIGFLGTGTHFVGYLIDLSTTGVLIRCAENLEVGTAGRLGIPVGSETARIGAVVRRLIPGVGIALEFSHMGPHDRELVRRLLLRLAKPPS